MLSYSNYPVQSVDSCTPDYELQVKKANIDIEKINNVLSAMEKCPYIEIDHRVVDQLVGTLYRARLDAEKRRDGALKQLEK